MWSLIRRGFGWWLGELAQIIPERLRGFFRHRSTFLVIELGDESASLNLVGHNKVDHLGNIDVRHQGAAGQRRDFDRLARGLRRRRTLINLRLGVEKILKMRITFPLAARANLRQALAFEMDRLTPFRSEDIFFDFTIVRTLPEEELLELDLTVATRRQVEDAVERLAAWNLVTDIVDVAKTDGYGAPTINLLAPEPAKSRLGPLSIAGCLLVGLALLQIAVIVMLPLQQRREALDKLNSQVAVARTTAEAASRLRQEFGAIKRSFEILYERRRTSPYTSVVLLEVTDRLPDDTWIKTFELNGNELKISGYSSSSFAVLESLQRSPMIDAVAFTAPVTQDNRRGVERFRLSGRILVREPS